MGDVNFKIRGNKPPFNVELRKDSPTGLLVNQKTVSASGTCETFTSLDYDNCYYLVSDDCINNTTSCGFISCGEPSIIDIDLTVDEFYTDNQTPVIDECDYCSVCGCVAYSPSMSSGQTYSLDFCYNQTTESDDTNMSSISCVIVYTGGTSGTNVFNSEASYNEICNGIYTVDNVTYDNLITFETYSCACACHLYLPDIKMCSSSTSSICLADTDNNVNANFIISTPNDMESYAFACKDPLSPEAKVVTSYEFYDNGGYQTQTHIACGCIVNTPSMVIGDSYDVKLNYSLNTTLSGDGVAQSRINIYCNNNLVEIRNVGDGVDYSANYTVNNVDYNDKITYCLYSYASVLDFLSFANAGATITINTLSDCQGSDFCIDVDNDSTSVCATSVLY